MDRSELDFYRLRFKVEVSMSPRTIGCSTTPTYVWKETDWMDHHPTGRDVALFISKADITDSEIVGIEMEHEHYIREKKETL